MPADMMDMPAITHTGTSCFTGPAYAFGAGIAADAMPSQCQSLSRGSLPMARRPAGAHFAAISAAPQ